MIDETSKNYLSLYQTFCSLSFYHDFLGWNKRAFGTSCTRVWRWKCSHFKVFLTWITTSTFYAQAMKTFSDINQDSHNSQFKFFVIRGYQFLTNVKLLVVKNMYTFLTHLSVPRPTNTGPGSQPGKILFFLNQYLILDLPFRNVYFINRRRNKATSPDYYNLLKPVRFISWV